MAELRLFKDYKALQAQLRAIIKTQDTRRGPYSGLMSRPLKCPSLGSSVSLVASTLGVGVSCGPEAWGSGFQAFPF